MGFERDSSKSGVGGFFQIFDWTAKSRKKLFSNKSDLPENSKQGKRSDGNLPTTRVSLMDDDETGIGTSFKGGSDFSCASSVTDEEGCGSRAPSVVARLMGLDSLPNSNFQEPYSTPYFDTRSLQQSHFHKKNFEYYNDHQILCGGNMLKKADGQSSRSLAEPKPKKTTPSRPIEKFQTEILPPKSAKSIPITQHRLLSPIKSPGFIPSTDVAHIMEAAAKIIEPGPRYPAKAKMPLGSSSVPLKVQALREKAEATQKATLINSSSAKAQDLREKVDTAHTTSRLAESSQRPVESNAAKYLKGQSMTESWSGSEDMSFMPSTDKEEGSSSSKNKGKSISLAIQAKVNVQKREGLNSGSSRGEISERQQSDAKSSPTFRGQQSTQKVMHKKPSTQNPSGVLRQNIQKQNSQVDKDNSLSKPLVSNSQSRKLLSRDSSGLQKASTRSSGNSKIGSRKSSLTGDGEKDAPYSTAKNFPRKKRSMDADLHFNKNPSNEKSFSTRNQKPAKSNSVTDVYNWAEEGRRKGMDVVSFTFTAPLTRPLSGSESPGQVGQRNIGFPVENQVKKVLVDSDGMKLSSLGYNGIGGDALSLLLEEKLRELTFGLESSVRNSAKGGSASSSTSRLENAIPSLDQTNQNFLSQDKFSGLQFGFEFSTTGPSSSASKQNFQEVSEMDESSSGHFEAGKFRSFRHPSPVSILEPSFSIESCDSTISDCNSTEGSKLRYSVQAQEVNSLSFTELSDSASSTSTSNLARKHATTLIMLDRPKATTGWELEYVKEILFNVELMFNDFALGRSRYIINPHLFNLLESRKRLSESSDGCIARPRRKVLFDCVSECLDLRSKRCVGGGYTMWVKGVAMVRRKERLAEEVYKEILSCESLGDSMVDELVDKDISSQYGRWLDFEVDEFALAVDCEAQIFDSLIDELIADIFLI